jgi:hypothetical protein
MRQQLNQKAPCAPTSAAKITTAIVAAIMGFYPRTVVLPTSKLIGCRKADPVSSALPPIHLFVHVRELCTQRNDDLSQVCNLCLQVCGILRPIIIVFVKKRRWVLIW